MFVSVETDNNGVLRLRDNNGYINSQQSGGLKINNAIPHYIQINRTTITIGNATYDVMLTSLPVRTVFVGGDEEVSAQAQFRGCIRDVRLNGQQLLFFNQTADGLNSTEKNIAEGCSGEDVCANTSGIVILCCNFTRVKPENKRPVTDIVRYEKVINCPAQLVFVRQHIKLLMQLLVKLSTTGIKNFIVILIFLSSNPEIP